MNGPVGSFDLSLIAPCGMNCGTCLACLRKKNTCPGCRFIMQNQVKTRVNCVIRNCAFLAETNSKYCYECQIYPCKRLRQLENRYNKKYGVSLMGNLGQIKEAGPEAFLKSERLKWQCGQCGGTVCIHRGYCLKCHKN